jgi:hypothetical protein
VAPAGGYALRCTQFAGCAISDKAVRPQAGFTEALRRRSIIGAAVAQMKLLFHYGAPFTLRHACGSRNLTEAAIFC